MPIDRKIDKEEDDKTGSGRGSATTFKWDVFAETRRDDAAPPAKVRQSLQIHKEATKSRIDKQKIEREQRLNAKNNPPSKTQGQYYGVGIGKGRISPYLPHPISKKAQFSGTDKQVIGIPSENQAKTNDDLRNELENRLENRLALTNQPKFNPKPRPY